MARMKATLTRTVLFDLYLEVPDDIDEDEIDEYFEENFWDGEEIEKCYLDYEITDIRKA